MCIGPPGGLAAAFHIALHALVVAPQMALRRWRGDDPLVQIILVLSYMLFVASAFASPGRCVVWVGLVAASSLGCSLTQAVQAKRRLPILTTKLRVVSYHLPYPATVAEALLAGWRRDASMALVAGCIPACGTGLSAPSRCC